MKKSTYYRILSNVEKMNHFIWFVGVLLSPFIFWLSAYVPYEIPRVWFLHRWIELLAIAVVFKKSRKVDTRLVVTVFLFIATALISSVVGADTMKSFLGNYWRGDGIITLLHFVGLSLLVGMYWNERWKQLFILATKLSLVAMTGWGVMMWLSQQGGVVGLSFGNPKLLSGWFLVNGILVCETVKDRTRLVYVLLMIIGLLLTGGWSSSLLAGMYVAIKFPKLRLIAGLVVLVGSVWWWQHSARVHFLGRAGVVYESRERILIKSFGGALQRPILGWGWANVDYAFRAFDWPFYIEHDVYLDKAHSLLLEIFVTTGLVGLAVYLVLNVELLIKLKHTVWFLPLVFFIIHSQTNVVSVGEEVYYWILLGIGLTQVEVKKVRKNLA